MHLPQMDAEKSREELYWKMLSFPLMRAHSDPLHGVLLAVAARCVEGISHRHMCKSPARSCLQSISVVRAHACPGATRVTTSPCGGGGECGNNSCTLEYFCAPTAASPPAVSSPLPGARHMMFDASVSDVGFYGAPIIPTRGHKYLILTNMTF